MRNETGAYHLVAVIAPTRHGPSVPQMYWRVGGDGGQLRPGAGAPHRFQTRLQLFEGEITAGNRIAEQRGCLIALSMTDADLVAYGTEGGRRCGVTVGLGWQNMALLHPMWTVIVCAIHSGQSRG